MQEPTPKQAKQIEKLVRQGDIYREQGGLAYRNGKITKEKHRGICRSAIILDWDDFDWPRVQFLWISHEMPLPLGIKDECCDWCENDKPLISCNDFLTPGEIAWSQEFSIPVVMFRPYSETPGDGVWDLYDPSYHRRAIGINLKPLSIRTGLSLKDPQEIDAQSQAALEIIKAKEKQIYEAWRERQQIYQDLYSTLKGKVEEAQRKLLELQLRADAALSSRHYSLPETSSVAFHEEPCTQKVLSPSELSQVDLGIPIQAFQYIPKKEKVLA